MNEERLKFKRDVPTKDQLDSLYTTYTYDNHKKGAERVRAWGIVASLTIVGQGKNTRYGYKNHLIADGFDPLDKNIKYKKDDCIVIKAVEVDVQEERA